MTVRHYPLDPKILHKGFVIHEPEIAEAMATPTDSPKFGFARLQLLLWVRQQIEGRGWAVAIVKGAVAILTDDQTATLNPRKIDAAMERALRLQRENMAVDPSRLPEDLRKKHERSVQIQGAMLAAAVKTRSDLLLKPTQRSTPALPNGTEPRE